MEIWMLLSIREAVPTTASGVSPSNPTAKRWPPGRLPRSTGSAESASPVSIRMGAWTPDFDKFFTTLPDKALQPIFDAAADSKVAMLFPYGERDGQHYCNSCAVIDKTGKRLGGYRKTHIPAIFPSNLPGGTGSYEKFYFSPGSTFPVFELCGTKIGIQICYDRKYPEGSRLLALKGAEIIFMPICAATYGETKLRGNTWELPLQARAYENGVYVVAVNRAGDENGRNHIGRSMIIDP